MKKLKIIAFIFLAIHLFAIHTRLIFHLNPDNPLQNKLFSFIILDEYNIISEIFAIAYSIMTAYVIYYSVKFYTIIVFASLDALAVFLYYKFNFAGYEILFGAIYYSLYTGLIIVAMKLIEINRKLQSPESIAVRLQERMNEILKESEIKPFSEEVHKAAQSEILRDQVLQWKSKGMKQDEIAKKLKISPSKVSRIINKK